MNSGCVFKILVFYFIVSLLCGFILITYSIIHSNPIEIIDPSNPPIFQIATPTCEKIAEVLR